MWSCRLRLQNRHRGSFRHKLLSELTTAAAIILKIVNLYQIGTSLAPINLDDALSELLANTWELNPWLTVLNRRNLHQ